MSRRTTRRWTTHSGWRRHLECVVLVMVGACGDGGTVPAPDGAVTNPEAAQLITVDVDRFWRAWDEGPSGRSAAVFQQRYLDSASPGLRNLMEIRGVTAASLVAMTTASPRYFQALRDWWPTVSTPSALATIRANYRRVQQEYPDAHFPPLYLVVGRFSTGGTVGREGLLVGAEFYGSDANAPLDELTPFSRNNQKSFREDFPLMVAHEHVHALQGRAGSTAGREGRTVLERSLTEGVAEFITARVAGRPTFHRFFVVWQQREREFWTVFERERQQTSIARWLYNQGTTLDNANAAWPGDLGYFIGYRIAEAYYARATDKRAALRALIRLEDAERILRESGYTGTGPLIAP